MNLVDTAKEIATRAHEGQTRKTDETPYILHPLAVAEMLISHDFDETVIAAAIVHDVLEDTDISELALRAVLGDTVVDIVVAVSEDKSLAWEERKERYVTHLADASDAAKAVSVADKIHNAESLLAAADILGPKVWDSFNRGKEQKLWFENQVLTTLQKHWDHPLVDRYAILVEKLAQLPE